MDLMHQILILLYEDPDGKIDVIKTIFSKDRLNNKAEDINFYFFNETSHDKITAENKENYIKKAFEIATDF